MASHQARGKYTTEFKLEAVRQVKSGQAISIVSRVLNVPKASLGNWVRQDRGGELGTTGDKPITAATRLSKTTAVKSQKSALSDSHSKLWTTRSP